MPAKKIVCLGAGSLYFPRALGDLVMTEDLAGSEMTLYDLDAEKAERMAAMGRRLADQAHAECSIRAATELADAVDGVDFAIASIGGSGAEITSNVYSSCYHSADMHIPAKYGIHQVVGDTAGPAGLMMGLRSIPAYLTLCREMERRCPNVVLLSHSNPMGVLCRAMNKYSSIHVVGICHGVQSTIHQAAEMLGVPAAELDCTWIGTNHYYWFLRVLHNGQDVTGKLQAVADELGVKGSDNLAHRLSRIYGYKVGYPGAGHLVEFYSWATHAPTQDDLPYDLAADARGHGFDERKPMSPRDQATPEATEQFYAQYQKILDAVKLLKTSKADYVSEEGVARMIAAIAAGREEPFIVNIPNAGAVPNLPDDAVIETQGLTHPGGVRGVPIGECPLVLKAMLEKRFAWQELVVDAAATGNRKLALQALMLDEMAIHPDKAEDMLDELLLASKDMLPQFRTCTCDHD